MANRTPSTGISPSRWKQRLTRALTAEVAAEKAASTAEIERRRTWWETTWALAAVPRPEWSEAQAEYIRRTGHSKSHTDHRRRTGERLPETALGRSLPQPKFAELAANWVGKDGDDAKVAEAVRLLADAEHDEMSLREFNQALTGKPWTNTAENLTEADEDAIVDRVARSRPAVVARQTQKPAVAEEVAGDSDNFRSVLKGGERVRKARRAASNGPQMPERKDLDPNRPEREPNELELLALWTELLLLSDGAADVRKAHDLLKRQLPYSDDERRRDLLDCIQKPIDAWAMLRDLVASGGVVTDEALEDLINQQQGGA